MVLTVTNMTGNMQAIKMVFSTLRKSLIELYTKIAHNWLSNFQT